MSPRPEKRRAPKLIVTGEPPVPPERPKERPWWWPTLKWWTLLVSGVTTVVGNALISGELGATERGMAGVLLIGLGASWAKSNKPKRSSWGRRREP